MNKPEQHGIFRRKEKVISGFLTGYCLRKRIAENRDRLYGLGLAWTGDAMVADDLVQETLMISLQRYHQLRDHERLNAWMYTILSNCWKQHLRRIRATVNVEEVNICSEHDAETSSSELEIVDRVRLAILKLPPGQRQTVTLVDLAGFSYAEVAEILDIPIGTVMSRLHTSRQSLQRVLANFRSQRPVEASHLRSVK
jgi:RNA polymerase sigma-70 factor (ECF subfamily)